MQYNYNMMHNNNKYEKYDGWDSNKGNMFSLEVQTWKPKYSANVLYEICNIQSKHTCEIEIGCIENRH